MMENKTKIDLKNKSVFITGVAGFIGSNLARRLLSTVEGVKVVGLDNMNHYYDVRLKEARLNELEQFENFSFVKGNLADKAVIESIFEQYKPEIVVNLGAQAGVRYSITNPDAYVEANLIGFYNILEACRHSYDEGHTPVEHLVYVLNRSDKAYVKILRSFIMIAIIQLMIGIAQYIKSDTIFTYAPMTKRLGSIRFYFPIVLMVFAYFWALNLFLNKKKRVASLIVMIAVLFEAMFVQQFRSTLMGILISTVVGFMLWKNVSYKKIGVFLVACIGAYIVYLNTPFLQQSMD